MSKKKNPQEERSIILRQPNKRPYGVKVRFHLQTAASLGYAEEVCLPLKNGAFISIAPARIAPWEGGKNYLATLEGFATATAAEMAGRRLVQSLLWTAINADFPLRLQYLSYEPATIFERDSSTGGVRCEGYMETGPNASVVFGELSDTYTDLSDPDFNILLSMEIFCAARLEGSQRATFLALVSALEPLANQKPLSSEVEDFLDKCISDLKTNDAIKCDTRNSLKGRLNQLKQESIRQAIKRVVSEILPNDSEAWKIVDSAYNLRSEIIHRGHPNDLDVDLYEEGQRVARIIRKIYAGLLNRTPVHSG